MFLYNYNTPNNKQLINKYISIYGKLESSNTENIKESRKPNFQTVSPFYSQNKINYSQTKKTFNHLTNSVESVQKHHNHSKRNYLNISLEKQVVTSSTNDINQRANQLPESINKAKEKKGKEIINAYQSAFIQGNRHTRKVLSANNSLEKASIYEKNSLSSKKESIFENNQNNNSRSPNNSIEGYRNNPKFNCSVSLNKETKYVSNINSNPLSYLSANNLDSIHNSSNGSIHLPSPKALSNLEEKLRNAITSPTFTSKSKQYNITKSIFEELILLYPIEHQIIMSKILSAYHQVIFLFSKENKELKETNTSFQKSNYTYTKLFLGLSINEKKKNEILSLLKMKEKELEALKNNHQKQTKKNSKLISLALTLNNRSDLSELQSSIIEQKEIEDNDLNIIEDNSKINNYIVGLHKKNLEDLDGLYFPDKVPNGSNLVSNQSIPILQINNKINKEESRQQRARAIYANILNMLEKEEYENNK